MYTHRSPKPFLDLLAQVDTYNYYYTRVYTAQKLIVKLYNIIIIIPSYYIRYIIIIVIPCYNVIFQVYFHFGNSQNSYQFL